MLFKKKRKKFEKQYAWNQLAIGSSFPAKWESESSKPLRAEIMGNFVSVLALPSAILAIGFARQLAFGLRFACRLRGLLAPVFSPAGSVGVQRLPLANNTPRQRD